ncbi:MAG TPA: cysteine hydrolase [Piscinibacter sp.]|jgi:nicotinamidase-related amidase|uniref:cysteine hydrolase family protein n=1 Tax=Piscinibacter sp. TaxID=1903157 RepID=UPI001B6A73FB|nr:cysteine hydrolase [Piscinibacter sp.]MBK7533452.1 cysteine hydrolase [Piscinibacter sp.]MBP6542961.1 cysteine hydrolase [Piscinibacter sp.]HOY36511.1 cysteine hydrolase [Piscinibacter sp.]HPG80245.1 cysteine hydrolase [Piscinibacter sp.]HPM66433.1 cysteine hydrolase [Piscinibacter sp.]
MPTVHARPYDFPFDPAHTAVVMIDMQRDFLEPGGFGAMLGNDVSLLRPIVPACVRLLALARAKGMAVIHTQEAHDAQLADCPPSKRARGALSCGIGDPGPLGRVLVAGEPGAGFVPELLPQPGDVVLRKPGKGAFHATSLDAILHAQGITHLLIGGVTTEVCVQSTMREANDRGYECLLVTDCAASYFPQFHAAVVEMMVAQGGIVGWAAPLAEIERAFA